MSIVPFPRNASGAGAVARDEELRELFGDLRRKAADDITKMIDGRVDLDEAIDAIVHEPESEAA
jgi:hypothetical protein